MDYASLMGFPIEIVALAIVCYTIIQIVTLVINRKKDKIELAHPKDEKQSSEPHGS